MEHNKQVQKCGFYGRTQSNDCSWKNSASEKQNFWEHSVEYSPSICRHWLLLNNFLFLPQKIERFDPNFDSLVCFVMVKLRLDEGYQIRRWVLPDTHRPKFVPHDVFLPMSTLKNESIGYNNESIFFRQTQMLMVFSPWYWCWPTLTRNNKGLLGDETKKCVT